jgi:hypothetical protein
MRVRVGEGPVLLLLGSSRGRRARAGEVDSKLCCRALSRKAQIQVTQDLIKVIIRRLFRKQHCGIKIRREREDPTRQMVW